MAGTNARVGVGPFLSSRTVNTPVAIASATHRRPAASKPLRQTERQNTWRLPPSRRGVNPFPHQRQTRCFVISKTKRPPMMMAAAALFH